MANNLDITRSYQSDTEDSNLTQQHLDDAFDDIESYATKNNSNMDQIKLDVYGNAGVLDNDGNKNLSQSLVDEIKRPSVMVWEDHFMEAANALASTTWSKAHWTGAGTNGTQSIVAGVGGWMQLDTTSTGSSDSSLTFTTANFDTNSKPSLHFNLKVDDVTNVTIKAGWRVDGNDYIYFLFDTDQNSSNIYLATNNNGVGEVLEDTGFDQKVEGWLEYRIEIDSNETFKAYINDQQVANNTTGTIRDLATFKPYFSVDNKSAAEQKLVDIDFVRIMQERIS